MEIEKLPASNRLLSWGELILWLREFEYPTLVRVFVNGIHRISVVLKSLEEISQLHSFPVSAEFYALRTKPG